MKKYLFLLLTLIGSYTANAKDGDNSNTIKSTLTAVTVYKVGAELTHIAKADVTQGSSELIIDGLSNSIDINSIQVNCNGNITIMGVEFGTDNLQDEVKTPAVKFLEDSVEKVNKNLNKVKDNIGIINQLLGVLKLNRDVRGSQTGLSVIELTKLMNYYEAKLISLQAQLDGLNDKQEKLTALTSKLTDQIADEEKKNTKQTGKLILQLNCAEAGRYDFTVSYITQNAYWEPFYDLKADNITSPLQIIYRAKIYQTTGIDWKQVKLSLSTSTPNESGNAPSMDTWFVDYTQPVVYYASPAMSMMKKTEDDKEQSAQVTTRGASNDLDEHTAIANKELNVSFDIDLPYDVPTNGKAQTAILKKYTVPASYKFFSIPKLDNQAYLLAQISDWEKLNLLPGEANIIFEGTYIGKSFIDPSSTDDTLKLTMGVDKRVVVTREKLMDYSSVKFLGSNKKQTFTYEITVKNNKKDAIDIAVKDQYPISQNKDIEVELLESKEAVVNAETGELTWNLKLAAGEVKKIRISYSIKYPKDKVVDLE
ncbi:MAG TPA: DUF4139 domain-containing protein [Ferruginibacter sp.]|nr:DUF4139 domain-containing protein [Ferruginibacter sp.]